MRILWCGPHPELRTGYGVQTADVITRLNALGHQVAVSCTGGTISHPDMWRGHPVFPMTPYNDYGEDVVLGHYQGWKADLCVTFLCTWILHPGAWRDMRVAHWSNVDCRPMSVRDYQVISATGGTPVATSRHGVTEMKRRGLSPLYVPHGTDTAVFRPPEDRDALRRAMDWDGKFVVGMNWNNNDKYRKNVQQALFAFASFHDKHPDARLALHTRQLQPDGYNLLGFTQFLGLKDAVIWSDQYQLVTGMASSAHMAGWYGALDCYLQPGNEGFGLPGLEAQACGTPGIFGGWSSGPQLCGPGWLLEGEPWWNDTHQALWHYPYIGSVVDALEKAYAGAGSLRGRAREFALGYDIDKVVAEHWVPVLAELEPE